MTGSESIAHALHEAMTNNSSIHVLGEALPLSGAAAPLLSAHPGQCHLLPASDATLVGTAVGIAMSGARAVVELSGPEALWGAIQQIGQEAASLHGEFQSTLVIRVPLTPDSPNPLPLFDGLDHIRVVSPASPADAGVLIQAALDSPGITVVLEPLTILSEAGGISGEARLGSASIATEGDHVTIAAWGDGVSAAHRAARSLSTEGISAEVIDLRSLSPLDSSTLQASVHKTGRIVVVNGSPEIMQTITEQAFLRLESPPANASTDQILSMARAAVHY